MYSFKISFCMVPDRDSGLTPCLLATATYSASKMDAVEFMVIEVLTLSSGMASKRISMSARVDTGTPVRPISPLAMGWSESYPVWVGRSNATLSPL